MAPVLGYWNIRSLGQPIRLLLKYTCTEFEDKRYSMGDAPNYDKREWLSVKYDLGLDFPNLPYYIDEDVKLTQSKAILRYLGRKHDLCGKTAEEMVRIDLLECQLGDMQNDYYLLTYFYYDEQKDDYLESLPTKLKGYSQFLGVRPWFAGERITYVDFLAYEVFDQHLCLDATCLDGFENLRDFQRRFEALEAIKRYLASSEFLKAPISSKDAKFGNK